MKKQNKFQVGEIVQIISNNSAESKKHHGELAEVVAVHEGEWGDSQNAKQHIQKCGNYWYTLRNQSCLDMGVWENDIVPTQTNIKKEEKNPRKNYPVFSGVFKYFPDALLEVAKVSYAGSQQHNPDQPLRWDRTKSTDEEDALTRHLLDIAKGNFFDTDGQRHSAKVAWRALANLQKEIENDRKEI